MQQVSLKLIRCYQNTLSPDHGWTRDQHPNGFCRFYPSCSQYTYESIEKYGMFKGVSLSLRRLLRCNPWHQGGVDLVK